MSSLINCVLQKNNLLFGKIKPCNIEIVRGAAKKNKTSTQNEGNSRAKHRGLKRGDGTFVHRGEILVTQLWTRFHPGLNVKMGRNGTLNALETGKVVVTCEKINPKWDHIWNKINYGERVGQTIYKKFVNVITEKPKLNFVLKDTV